MIRTDSISPMGDGALVVTSQGINGDAVLRHSKTVNAPPGMIIRMPPAPTPGSDAEAQALRNSRAEMARLTVALLLAAPPSMPLEFTYGGEAEAADGQADIVNVKGPNNFVAQLFLDKATHRPLMLSYKGVAQQIRVQTQRGPAPAGGDAHGGGRGDDAAGLPGMPPLVEINMFLDDYKAVDGVMLPHHVTRSVDGQANEEWTLTSIKVNPAFKADTFSAK
jgi:hypothetical protein